MPELPEVETIARKLRPELVGRQIVGARLLWTRTLATPTPEEFTARLIGQTILDTGRRAKFLILSLSQDQLLLHLRMSGDVYLEPAQGPLAFHHRLVLDLANPSMVAERGQRLAFNDPRKFGRAWLVNDPQEILGKLGPEPLDEAFTPEVLYQRLQAHRRQLKPLLLDQKFIAGLGNIYADESLHRGKIHPLTLAHTVTSEQAAALWVGIRAALQEGIRRNGASIDWVYRGGDFQNFLRAYGRTGDPCIECGTPIKRIVVGQRSAHYCPNCQKAPE